MDFKLCTHIIYAFASYNDISSEKSTKIPGEITVNQFIAQKEKHKNVKFLISVGGGGKDNTPISKVR